MVPECGHQCACGATRSAIFARRDHLKTRHIFLKNSSAINHLAAGIRWLEDPYQHYIAVIMGAMASQITSLTIVCSIVYSDADQRKHQSSASLAFVRRIHVTGEFPAKMSSNAENVPIWWRHHGMTRSRETISHVIYSLRRHRPIGVGIPIINLRRSLDRLRYIMGIPIPVRRRLYSE